MKKIIFTLICSMVIFCNLSYAQSTRRFGLFFSGGLGQGGKTTVGGFGFFANATLPLNRAIGVRIELKQLKLANSETRITSIECDAILGSFMPDKKLITTLYIGPSLDFVSGYAVKPENSTNLGLSLGAGIGWLITDNFAVYLEAEPRFSFRSGGVISYGMGKFGIRFLPIIKK